ncbi:MAG: hypothetical protein FWE61_06265 [Micrococcales bacterium]|nr:hypothetical protein [Micrococcales bacterium]
MNGVTLDAGPLIALDRHHRTVIVLLAAAERTAAPVVIPATALAQALRNPAGQARLMRLVRQPRTVMSQLDRADAANVGVLLAATGTSDIADAHVVVCARRAGHPIVTSDPDDLRALDPAATLVPV